MTKLPLSGPKQMGHYLKIHSRRSYAEEEHYRIGTRCKRRGEEEEKISEEEKERWRGEGEEGGAQEKEKKCNISRFPKSLFR